MPVLEAIPSKQFSEAKAELSALMDQVVRQHRPTLIERRRESMVALSLEDLQAVLGSFRFEPRAVVRGSGTVATLEQFGLVGTGPTIDAAVDDLLDEMRAYVADFITRYAFYMHTDRRTHVPWVLRFALTPINEQRDLLLEEPTDEEHAIR